MAFVSTTPQQLTDERRLAVAFASKAQRKPWFRWLGPGLLCLVFLSTAQLRAQGIPSAADAPREGEVIRGNTGVVDIAEVERGWFVGVDYGANYYFPLSGADFVSLNPNGTSLGTRMDLRVGYDLLNNIQVEGFVLANFNTGKLDAQSLEAGKLTGDLAQFTPGFAVRYAFFNTKRVFAYTRGGLGFAFWSPNELAGGYVGSIHTDIALGVEYYTQLRHLSVGLEATVQALLFPTAVGLQIYPTLKYTF